MIVVLAVPECYLIIHIIHVIPSYRHSSLITHTDYPTARPHRNQSPYLTYLTTLTQSVILQSCNLEIFKAWM